MPSTTPTDVDTLIRTLEDPQARDALIARLKALEQQVRPTESGAAETTLVSTLVDEVQKRQAVVETVAAQVADSWLELPFLLSWASNQMVDANRRAFWIDVILRLGVVFVAGLAVRSFICRRLTRHAEIWTNSQAVRTLLGGLGAVAGFIATTMALLLLLYQPALAEQAGIQLVIGVAAMLVWSTANAALLGPMGLLGLEGENAKAMERGVGVIGKAGLLGHFALEAAQGLGLPWTIYGFFQHVLYFLVTVSLCVLVIRLRTWIAKGIGSWSRTSSSPLVRFLPLGFIASSWHIWAISWIFVHYLVWALRIPGGFSYLFRATVLTAIILGISRWLVLRIDRAFASGVPIAAESEEFLPGVQERATVYANPLRLVFRWLVIVSTIMALLRAWETGIFTWLSTDNGQMLVGIVLRLATVAIVAIVMSEGISLVTSRFIGAVDENGQPRHSNRSRTMASILRNFGIVLIIATAIMVSLSELGVDAAALLAGAGVVGLAVGFGSQRLVQDLITGLFILLGDTIRVGDVVEVGGKAGVVDSMSMRTVTLRSYDGSVHTVPYSSIDIVTNLTKDFSFAVLEIGVAYRENVDDVMQVMREVDAGMRREWPYRRQILAPLEIAGVDALGDSAVVIKARSKTRPGEQWAIRRELTRRLKNRFDDLGIEIPFPHQTIYFGSDKTGKAPPVFVEHQEPTPGEGGAGASRKGDDNQDAHHARVAT